ncbi:hypothetical protein K504DRAFT_466493 [Pleomassaria siparia CBS 279.74]|uniref:Uncharacterized protein n=1 Tax=Pleomassaria siparia CBS 279.74 TaxID=1314801 RepID=A0A6G1KBQ1_9PLEO|nr:hypothetical protein K504DRAFT_466493 [Pleomassaria siparia CBS 279.74]
MDPSTPQDTPFVPTIVKEEKPLDTEPTVVKEEKPLHTEKVLNGNLLANLLRNAYYFRFQNQDGSHQSLEMHRMWTFMSSVDCIIPNLLRKDNPFMLKLSNGGLSLKRCLCNFLVSIGVGCKGSPEYARYARHSVLESMDTDGFYFSLAKFMLSKKIEKNWTDYRPGPEDIRIIWDYLRALVILSEASEERAAWLRSCWELQVPKLNPRIPKPRMNTLKQPCNDILSRCRRPKGGSNGDNWQT